MPTFTRNNAWDNGGTLEGNSDLLWYAIGVGKMMQRDISDPKSWWYFAAIHGDNVPTWAQITAPPTVPPLPSSQAQGWAQCQHATWYFPPWHRGYLIALESQVREDIVSLGGPSTWALPYWDYFGQNPANQFNIPPAFTQQTFPPAASLPSGVPSDIPGSPNPLYVTARYGPNGDGTIFVPTQAGIDAYSQDPNSDFGFGTITEDCLSDTIYTASFGGAQTGFDHDGSASGSAPGDLENNPHNLVHVYVGGAQGNQQNGEAGMMSDPDMAGLDPIFYLHHAQIDRMWAIWNVTLRNSNSNDASWLYGPTTNGQSDFQMPMNGSWWYFTPSNVTNMGTLDYTYEDMSAPASVVHVAQAFTERVAALRPQAAASAGVAVMQPGPKVELLGATQSALVLKGAGARTPVQLDAGVRRKVAASLVGASHTTPPDRVYLRLDNVTGTIAGVLSVYINLPDGGKPAQHRELLAGSVGLFGLRQASEPDGKHGGKGMSFTLDITKVIDQLHLSKSFDLDTLQVSLIPSRAIPGGAPITVGRISIYRQGH